MGFYTTTRIITATKSQLDAMCYAQEDFVNILDNKTTQRLNVYEILLLSKAEAEKIPYSIRHNEGCSF
ncbi:hypothetical protein LSPH24S_01967 [Lysinibacillus sphaericus]